MHSPGAWHDRFLGKADNQELGPKMEMLRGPYLPAILI